MQELIPGRTRVLWTRSRSKKAPRNMVRVLPAPLQERDQILLPAVVPKKLARDMVKPISEQNKPQMKYKHK